MKCVLCGYEVDAGDTSAMEEHMVSEHDEELDDALREFIPEAVSRFFYSEG